MSSESDSDYSKGLTSYVSQSVPQAMNQSELNDLNRDLHLSTDQSQILALGLKEINMLRAFPTTNQGKVRFESSLM